MTAKAGELVETGAGVLELLRQFEDDSLAADGYADACNDRLAIVEPSLKAFEYPPQDLTRHPGPLSGVPIAIKDIIATSDIPTTNGSPVYKGNIPDADAWVVARLRRLGATIFGKTVSTEFAWRHPGPTANPWNTRHTPGGSSSGSAAAVAAGLVPLALGTQTLGSIVRPAAFNGVVGFKPSFGAIPRTGVHPLSPSLDHVGFFARRVDDVAMALSLLAASSNDDVHGRPVLPFTVSVAHGLKPIERPKLAIVRFAKWSRVEPAQQHAFVSTIASLRDAGADMRELDLPDLDHTNWSTINTILAYEGAQIFADIVARHPNLTSDHLKLLVANGQTLSLDEYRAAKSKQDELRQDFAATMNGFDAVLTLPAFGEAPEGLYYTGDAEYCAPWTLLGVPALSLPVEFGNKGLPLGIQLVGGYLDDLRMLCVAKWIEGVLKFNGGLADPRK